jgi:hypothetical protein
MERVTDLPGDDRAGVWLTRDRDDVAQPALEEGRHVSGVTAMT